MAAKRKPFLNIRVVFQRSAPGVKIAIIALLVVCTVTLVALSISIGISKAKTEALRQEAVGLEQENASLSEDISEFGTIKSFKELAAKLLGLVDPDTVFFSPED